jgi:hypothetical protein
MSDTKNQNNGGIWINSTFPVTSKQSFEGKSATPEEPGATGMQTDSLHVSGTHVQGLIFGLIIGAFIDSSTSIILSMLICTITNVKLPEALQEYTGHNTPQQLIFSWLNTILSKTLGLLAGITNKNKKRSL